MILRKVKNIAVGTVVVLPNATLVSVAEILPPGDNAETPMFEVTLRHLHEPEHKVSRFWHKDDLVEVA